MTEHPRLPTFADIEAAAGRIEAQAVRTPLLHFPVLDEATGGRIFVKPECLQRTGSFKFRGAFNTISQILPEHRARGVVACSSGNHAQGVAAAAKILGLPATIVMPQDAPAIKLERTRALGATVVTYDRYTEDRDAIAHALCEKTGARFVHPYNDHDVIAGQGTAGLEIMQDLKALGITADAVLSPAGGGGLLAGLALAIKTLGPAVAVHGVEPEGFDDQARSLRAGARQKNEKLGGSICDAILTPMPGELSFAMNHGRVGPGLVVSDDEALAAVGFAATELKLVVEPGAAVALAAVLTGKLETKGKTLVVMASGGNIDPPVLARALGLPG